MMNNTYSPIKESQNNSLSSAPTSLLQRKCACGGSADLSGECNECKKKKLVGEKAPEKAPLVQPKLKISQPNDKYEQEADRVADEVMRMPEPRVQQQVGPEEEEEDETIQSKSSASKITPLVQRQVADEEEDEEELPLRGLVNNETVQRQVGDEEDEEEAIQTKGTTSRNNPTVTRGVQSVIESLKGNTGKLLPKNARSFMECRFGQDFSRVRIYTDRKANQTARNLQARAFTIGSHIAFGAGQFTPEATSGRLLLAHELAHTLQQRSSTTTIHRRKLSPQERKNDSPPLKRAKRRSERLRKWLRDIEVTRKIRNNLTNRLRSKWVILLHNAKEPGFDLHSEYKPIVRQRITQLQPDINLSQDSMIPDIEKLEVPEEPKERELQETEQEESFLNGPFSSVEDAVSAFEKKWNPLSIQKNEEICTIIVKKGEEFFYHDPWQISNPNDRRHSCSAYPPSGTMRRKPKNFAGEIHTHGGPDPIYDNENPSPTDRQGCTRSGGPCFIVTPTRSIKKYGPDPRNRRTPSIQFESEINRSKDKCKQKTDRVVEPLPILRARKNKKEDKARTNRMLVYPDFAHKVWERSSTEERKLVLKEMRKLYGNDWVDEFLTLQENGFRGKGATFQVFIPTSKPPVPSDEELEFQGYVRVRRFEFLIGQFLERWVRPDGSTIKIIKGHPKEKPPPPGRSPEEPEEDVTDFTRDEIEDMVGHEIKGFKSAVITKEDEQGNREIAVIERSVATGPLMKRILSCEPDDTCVSKMSIPLEPEEDLNDEEE